jgi:exopolyphosphatase/guanosine-5'-triphosphate,3'-diphosphate pyrophosphatase
VTRRVAAVDCGTNSLRLLLAEIDPGRAGLTDVVRRMEIVRLGQGVDQTGRLAPEALARTMAVLREYADVIARSGAQAVRMVATSATRDADNAAEFVRLVKEVLGVAPEVLTGDEEAVLSFTGATAELAGGPDPGPFLVVDIGGGSTEFVLGWPRGDGLARGDDPPQTPPDLLSGGTHPPGPPLGEAVRPPRPPGPPWGAISVNVGCVRMTERHLHGDPPAGQEVGAAVADIDAALDTVAAAVPVRDARTLIGLAGSVTTVAAIAMGLPAYDAARIHHARVAAADVHAVTRGLLAQTRAERAALGVMHPGRADVIGGGALVLDRLMQRFGFTEVLVSEHDILDGMAWSLAGDLPGAGTGAQWEQVHLSRRAAGRMTPPDRARPSRAVPPR